ncbi:MAG TPA: hypothetical protein VMV29_23325 [Ktedonobacterales bacterium]|nr:hypothetical protein [Ktedonobacterales bacterium]
MADDDELALLAQDDGMRFELLASSLRADANDAGAFMEALAEKLGGALPQRARVERGGGMFSHKHPVRRIALNLGDYEYVVVADGGGALSAARTHLVRGIALKSESLGLDEWIETLAAELTQLADRSAQDRAALQRLLG